MDEYWVLAEFPADGSAPHIWTAKTSKVAARVALDDAPRHTPWEVMSMEDYIAKSDAYWSNRSTLCEITEEQFSAALNVLPPYWYGFHQGNECFFMSEFDHGSWTAMYAHIGSRYFCRSANVRDRATWITSELLATREIVDRRGPAEN